METTTSLKTFEVTIPEKYADILKKFITSLEGKVKAQKKSGLDEALEDVKAGRIHKYENFEAFKQKMLELLLIGKYAGLWECHIQGDWLLIWSQDDTELILLFTDIGTHSDLF